MLELPQCDGFKEKTQTMFKSKNKKKKSIIRLTYVFLHKSWLQGDYITRSYYPDDTLYH